ncbi:hypothetical protein N7519_008670 [Penicillium mononematosum]|uniref:uncharacterized protein n=1 Tax=Penicillium mononematosum TaxID=268346 RepID=UPI0025475FE4|nr:uncharacterized protein N7519_008670 [Penicillium mononematosum]KAJ6178209.1 hypothetical protein N7519_008670 [Penicillium mononematosum]
MAFVFARTILLSFKPDENSEMLIKCIETARAIAENSKDTVAYGVLDSFQQELKASEAEFQK